MQKEVLKSKEKLVRAISPLDDIVSMFSKELQEYGNERVKRGIRSKFIYTSSKGPTLKDSDQARLRESKFISPSELPIKFDFTVFDNTVKIEMPDKKMLGIVIQHPQIAESFKNLFDFVWDSIK